MARNYTSRTNIILGFCAYGHHKGFFHKLVAYDNLITGLQYISSALTGNPYTGNGRNLSYRKDLFFAHKGYYKSLSLHAGDDDLFINESANRSEYLGGIFSGKHHGNGKDRPFQHVERDESITCRHPTLL